VDDLKQLREDLEKRVAAAAQEVESAKDCLRKAESDFAAVSADAQRRLAAIQLVEEMLAAKDREVELYPYRHMTQEEAMRAALVKAGEMMNSSELAAALKDGGYPFRSNEPANVVIVSANTNRNGYFSKVKDGNRTLIGLKEWGPDGEAPSPFDDFLDNIDHADTGPGALR
jgi:aspartokinase